MIQIHLGQQAAPADKKRLKKVLTKGKRRGSIHNVPPSESKSKNKSKNKSEGLGR
jgi:hypothetical protein